MKTKALVSGYVLLFDGSLNNAMKKYQLDMHVKVWNDNLTWLVFLWVQNNCIRRLSKYVKKKIKFSMDGSNVNWNWFGLIKRKTWKNKQAKKSWLLERSRQASLVQLDFCNHWWFENVDTAEHALLSPKIYLNVTKKWKP